MPGPVQILRPTSTTMRISVLARRTLASLARPEASRLRRPFAWAGSGTKKGRSEERPEV